MSKGYGPIQRRVVAIYEQTPNARYDAFQLAAEVYDVPVAEDGVRQVTDAQLSAVRRALGTLMKSNYLTCAEAASNRAIAKMLGVSPRTVGRDLRSNSGGRNSRKQWYTVAAEQRRQQALRDRDEMEQWRHYGY